jgi:DNA-binding transcriptional LysR family regulator
LSKDEVDLVITMIDRTAPPGFESLVLMELPMVLLVEKNSKIKSAAELWKRDKIDEALICLPAHEAMTKNFQTRLAALGVEWFSTMEASSADLIETYVANGLGIGVSVSVPGKALPKNMRALALPDFPGVVVGALWRGKKSPLLEAFLDMAKVRAKEIAG